MGKVIINDTTLTSIADAIRTKNGESNLYLPSEMPQKILDIQGGGGSVSGGGYNIDFINAGGNFVEQDFIDAVNRGEYINCSGLYTQSRIGSEQQPCTDGLAVKITDANYMFFNLVTYNNTLETLNCSKFDVSKCINMEYMFGNIGWLKNINLSSWDTGRVEKMDNLFYNCYNLADVDMSMLNLNNLKSFSSPFYWCTKLTTLVLPDLPAVTKIDLFGATSGLTVKNLTFANNGSFGNNSATTSLTLSLARIWRGGTEAYIQYYTNFANSIGPNTSGKTRTISIYSTLYNKLTDAQKTLLTDKGYTLSSSTT